MRKLIYLSIILLFCSICQSEAKTWVDLSQDIPKHQIAATENFFKKYANDPKKFFKEYSEDINAKTLSKQTPLRFFSNQPNIFKHLGPILLEHEKIDVDFVYKNESVLTNILYDIGREIENQEIFTSYFPILQTLVNKKSANTNQKNNAENFGLEIVVEAMSANNESVFQNKKVYYRLSSIIELIPVTQSSLKTIESKAYSSTKELAVYKKFMKQANEALGESTKPPGALGDLTKSQQNLKKKLQTLSVKLTGLVKTN